MDMKRLENEFRDWRRRQARRYELEDALAMLVMGFFWLAVWATVMALAFSSVRL